MKSFIAIEIIGLSSNVEREIERELMKDRKNEKERLRDEEKKDVERKYLALVITPWRNYRQTHSFPRELSLYFSTPTVQICLANYRSVRW